MTWRNLVLAAIAIAVFPAVTSAQTRPMTLQDGLTGELNALLASRQFGEQLAHARKQYPALVAGFEILLARRPLAPVGFTPVNPDPVQWPADLCRWTPLTCKCRGGDRDACVAMVETSGAPGFKPGAILIRIPTCTQLVQQYRDTLNAITALLAQAPLNAAQLDDLARLQAESQALYQQIAERGCLTT